MIFKTLSREKASSSARERDEGQPPTRSGGRAPQLASLRLANRLKKRSSPREQILGNSAATAQRRDPEGIRPEIPSRYLFVFVFFFFGPGLGLPGCLGLGGKGGFPGLLGGPELPGEPRFDGPRFPDRPRLDDVRLRDFAFRFFISAGPFVYEERLSVGSCAPPGNQSTRIF
jgi:hypothetical protein